MHNLGKYIIANALIDLDQYRYVLVLYLDRPLWEGESGAGLGGRFGYSDLKEAAFSGAAGYGSWIEFNLFGAVISAVERANDQVERMVS